MKCIILSGLAITICCISLLNGMDKRGTIVGKFLEKPGNTAVVHNLKVTLLKNNSHAEQGILDFTQSLPEAFTYSEVQNAFAIDAEKLNLSRLLQGQVYKKTDEKSSKSKNAKDTAWYHQATNHKLRTAVFLGVAVTAFAVGKYYSK